MTEDTHQPTPRPSTPCPSQDCVPPNHPNTPVDRFHQPQGASCSWWRRSDHLGLTTSTFMLGPQQGTEIARYLAWRFLRHSRLDDALSSRAGRRVVDPPRPHGFIATASSSARAGIQLGARQTVKHASSPKHPVQYSRNIIVWCAVRCFVVYFRYFVVGKTTSSNRMRQNCQSL